MTKFQIGRRTEHEFEPYEIVDTEEEAIIAFRKMIETVASPEEIRIFEEGAKQPRRDLEEKIEVDLDMRDTEERRKLIGRMKDEFGGMFSSEPTDSVENLTTTQIKCILGIFDGDLPEDALKKISDIIDDPYGDSEKK